MIPVAYFFISRSFGICMQVYLISHQKFLSRGRASEWASVWARRVLCPLLSHSKKRYWTGEEGKRNAFSQCQEERKIWTRLLATATNNGQFSQLGVGFSLSFSVSSTLCKHPQDPFCNSRCARAYGAARDISGAANTYANCWSAKSLSKGGHRGWFSSLWLGCPNVGRSNMFLPEEKEQKAIKMPFRNPAPSQQQHLETSEKTKTISFLDSFLRNSVFAPRFAQTI